VFPRLLFPALALALAVTAVPGFRPAAPVRAETVPDSRAQMQLSFAPLVRKVAPAVVNIYAATIVGRAETPYSEDPMLSQLLRELQNEEPRVENSLGSGVILTADGLVVSNFHVVGQADEITVVLADRREYAADLILGDEESDLAFMRLRGASGLPTVPMADSDKVEVGELVLAIGNPFGVGQTVSSGIISGLGRSTLSEGSERGYFLQTDAPINPGNSGGALIDMDGRLLGINTSILTRDGGSDGVGFAIPANLVAAMVPQAEAGASRFDRPWIGLTGQSVDARLAADLGFDRPQGMLVTDLHRNSPFADAGLRPGDVILALGGTAVHSPPEVDYRILVAPRDAALGVTFLRDGRAMQAEVDLSAPGTFGRAPATARRITIEDDVALRGLTVTALDSRINGELGLPGDTEGVVAIVAVNRAGLAGLRPGDVILSVNGIPVTRPDEVADLARDRRRDWTVEVFRGGDVLTLRFRS
jgi:Do/DeqQ family serine protease